MSTFCQLSGLQFSWLGLFVVQFCNSGHAIQEQGQQCPSSPTTSEKQQKPSQCFFLKFLLQFWISGKECFQGVHTTSPVVCILQFVFGWGWKCRTMQILHCLIFLNFSQRNIAFLGPLECRNLSRSKDKSWKVCLQIFVFVCFNGHHFT